MPKVILSRLRREPSPQVLNLLGKEPGSWEDEELYKDMHTKHIRVGGGEHGGEASIWSSGEQDGASTLGGGRVPL